MIRKMSGINFRNLLATAVVVTSALGALGARADTAAYSFDSVGASAVQTDLSLGDTFTVSSPITVTSLGYFNETGAGFLTPHEVGIFNAAHVLIADTVLAAGSGDPLIDGFRYQSISPLTLTPGQQYNLVGEAEVGDPWAYIVNGLSVASPITLGTVYYLYQSDNVLRDTTLYGSPYSWQVYAGPNFQFTTSTIPEIPTWTMMLVGFGVLGVALCSGRKAASATV